MGWISKACARTQTTLTCLFVPNRVRSFVRSFVRSSDTDDKNVKQSIGFFPNPALDGDDVFGRGVDRTRKLICGRIVDSFLGTHRPRRIVMSSPVRVDEPARVCDRGGTRSRYHRPWRFFVTRQTFTFLSSTSVRVRVRVRARVVFRAFDRIGRSVTSHRRSIVSRSRVASHRTRPNRTEPIDAADRSFVRSFDDRRSRG